MTAEEKDILIAKMLDAPSALTEEELALIAHDDELREIQEISSAIDGVNFSRQPIDTAAEWARFRPRLRKRPFQFEWLMRAAVIFLCISCGAWLTVRIIDRIMTPEEPPLVAEVLPPDDATLNIALPLEPEQPLANNSSSPSKRAQSVPTVIEDDDPAEEEVAIDVDEYIRIQQAKIDNEIAMLEAEAIEEDYTNLSMILDMMGIGENEDMEMKVKRLTLQ